MLTSSHDHLNGKGERSQLTDEEEFYQLLTYKDVVDLQESSPTGNTSINFADLMAPSMERHLTKHSEKSYKPT